MKKLIVLAFVFCLSLFIYAETKQNVFVNERVTVFGKVQEKISLDLLKDGEYAGEYILTTITLDTEKNETYNYYIRGANEHEMFLLLFKLIAKDLKTVRFDNFLEQYTKNNYRFIFLEDSVEKEHNTVVSSKYYLYKP